ncbi:hypothetical protein FQA47_022061 [Oryzias melastigma]|uniref:Clip domain-containing protein n=1 Tax=Oryzias melastigma TaxID=30732 RepID=A0A834FJL0_ORYME|nr:hypothetical protein FQA47_022061 [Oryzias melastigma]
MSRITAGIVLFILLINCVCSNTGKNRKDLFLNSIKLTGYVSAVEEFLDVGFTKQEIRRCACKRIPRGKLLCPSGLVPKNDDARQDLHKCLCKHFYKSGHPKMQVFCPPRISQIQTPL